MLGFVLGVQELLFWCSVIQRRISIIGGGFFSPYNYYSVSRRFPCAIQEVVLDYLLIFISVCMLIPKS